jgi:RNA polymerase subunit RPABC4/transcription elongation factor Spt4
MGPLTDEERTRLEEIERIRLSAQRDFWSEAGAQAGPVTGPCDCGRPLRANWRFCPFCGAANTSGCSRCHGTLPDEEGVQFCPQCGGRASRPA